MRTFGLISWILIFLGLGLLARDFWLFDRLTVWRDIDRLWSEQPPRSTTGFWRFETLVVTRPSDERLVKAIERVLRDRFNAHSVRQYHAIPLSDYLAQRGPEIGEGPFLTITNIRGEQLYLTREVIERERPVIVIGLDDQRELFRLYERYRLKREYSWEVPQSSMPWMIRPLGAFLHYPNAPDPRPEFTSYAPYALQPDGFRLSDKDPLAPARGVPKAVAELLYGSTSGCLTCHMFRAAGGRSHHIRATTGLPQGGYALPLDRYERHVIERFLFDQDSVADTIGVSPFRVQAASARILLQTIDQDRQGRRHEQE